MGIRLMLSGWWLRGLVFASLLFIAFAVFEALRWWQGQPPRPWAIAIWAAVSVVAGGLWAIVTRKSHDAYDRALDGLEGERRSAAITATARGPIPADPGVRRAALQLVQVTLGLTQRNRRLTTVLFALVIVMQLAIALITLTIERTPREAVSPLVIAALFAVALVGSWYTRRQLARRAQLLADAAEQPSA